MAEAGTDTTVVSDIRHSNGEYSFTVAGPLGEHRVRFWGDLGDDPAVPRSEPALAVALLPAMAVGGELSVPGPLSPRLRRVLPDVQAILSRIATESALMTHSLQPVEVTTRPPGEDPGPPDARPTGVGCFFSGGVDSWQALLDNPDVTDAIYVHGFDIPIDRPDVSAVVESRQVEAVARQGRRLRVVRTNLRDLVDPSADWVIAHGPAMAAVALLLSPSCGRALVPSTNTYARPSARGSHPLLDHLWSTESCRIEHYGAYLTRPRKIEQVAECQDALDVLRVCWRQVDRYNCGECEKCLRTMVTLEALGALERCPAFSAPINLDLIASLQFRDPELPIFWRENLELVHQREASTDLSEAIETCLSNAAAEQALDGDSLAREQLQSVIESRSWRLTAPFRRFGAKVRRRRERESRH